MFEFQLMGIEVPSEFGGADCNFMTSVIVVEEISKIDPSLAVLVHIQNALTIRLLKKLGTDEQKAKYLPKLAKYSVSSI